MHLLHLRHLHLSRHICFPGNMLGPTYLRPGEAALVAAVLGTGAAQEQLVPALMKVLGP